MVDNVAGDDVELKPAKNEAFGDVKPKPVPIDVVCEGRDTASFFYKCKMERARRVTCLGWSTRGKGRI